jgi:drug/metabolite transporter (DMT)-like permease
MDYTKKLVSAFGLLLSSIFWGASFLVVKDALYGINPIMLITYRFIIATIIFAGIVLLRKEKLFKNWRSGFLLGGVLFLQYITLTFGIKYTSVSNAGFITGLFVLFTPLFCYLFFRRIPTVLNVISIAISLLGLWFLTGGIESINNGDLLIILQAMATALIIVLADKYVKNSVSPFTLNFQQFLVVACISLVLGLFLHLPFSIPNSAVIAATGYLAIFSTVIAFGIMFVAQKSLKPFIAALLMSMEPVFAAIFAWTIGHEKIIISHAIGGLCIFIAILIAELPIKRLSSYSLRLFNKEFEQFEH